MIPEKVSFTGLEIDPRDVHSSRKVFSGTYPSSWTRYAFTVPANKWVSMQDIDRYLENNIVGHWGSYITRDSNNNNLVVIVFEHLTDAIMFRMKGGEKEWQIKEEGDE